MLFRSTAIIAKERDPNRDVVLIEAHEVGSQASGRNGGFMEASLTHGVANAQSRFPNEVPLLEELGLRNLNAIEEAIRKYNIDCDYERTGVIDVATTAHPGTYVDEMREDFLQLRSLGQNVEWLDRDAMHKQIHSPTYLGGLWRKDRAALVDPARLVWGLKRVAESLGVHIYEDTKATNIERDGVGVLVETALGRVRAGGNRLARGFIVDAAIDLKVDGAARGIDGLAQALHLLKLARDESLTAETGIDAHHQHQIDLFQYVIEHLGRGRRVERHARLLAERLDALDRAVQMWSRLLMHGDDVAARLGKGIEHRIDRGNHQVYEIGRAHV